jgi:hypothetical protein
MTRVADFGLTAIREDCNTGAGRRGESKNQSEEQVKWQKANGKWQMENHLNFAICHLNFDLFFWHFAI